MRKLILAAAIGLTLAGCETTMTAEKIATAIAQIRAATVAACGFLPTVDTVANIVAADNSSVQRASQVANAICQAVSPLNAAAADRRIAQTVTKPTVNGVVIKGKWVKRKK